MGLGLWRRNHWPLFSQLVVPLPRGTAESALPNRCARAAPPGNLMSLCWEGPEPLCFPKLPGDPPWQPVWSCPWSFAWVPSPLHVAHGALGDQSIRQGNESDEASQQLASTHCCRALCTVDTEWTRLSSPSPHPFEEGSERSPLDGGRSEVPG